MKRSYCKLFLSELIPHSIRSRLPYTSWSFLSKELSSEDKVLDIGSGPRSRLIYYNVKYSVGVEAFEPYVAEAKRLKTHNEIIHANCTVLDFEPKSFDVVVAFDLLEHLDKEEGLKLIEKMKSWSGKKVIIKIPNGFTPGNLIDENKLQLHKAGYSPKELQDFGFKVFGLGLKLATYGSPIAIVDIISRVVTYPLRRISWYHPDRAFDLIAVYTHPDSLARL